MYSNVIQTPLLLREHTIPVCVKVVCDNPVSVYKITGVDTSDLNAVVVGLAPSMFHYEKLTEAANLLIDGAELIAINKSRYFKRQQGLALGAGMTCSMECMHGCIWRGKDM